MWTKHCAYTSVACEFSKEQEEDALVSKMVWIYSGISPGSVLVESLFSCACSFYARFQTVDDGCVQS